MLEYIELYKVFTVALPVPVLVSTDTSCTESVPGTSTRTIRRDADSDALAQHLFP